MLTSQRLVEPRGKRLEESLRTGNELPCIQQAMQGGHHRQHPVATRRMYETPPTKGVDQHPQPKPSLLPRMGLPCPPIRSRHSRRDRVQEIRAWRPHPSHDQPGHPALHDELSTGEGSLIRKIRVNFQGS